MERNRAEWSRGAEQSEAVADCSLPDERRYSTAATSPPVSEAVPVTVREEEKEVEEVEEGEVRETVGGEESEEGEGRTRPPPSSCTPGSTPMSQNRLRVAFNR